MKKKLLPLMLFCAILTGCSSEAPQTTVSLPPLEPETEAAAESDAQSADETAAQSETEQGGLVYYVTDLGTQDPEQFTAFRANMSAHYMWQNGELADVPAASDTLLVLNAPAEDLTQSDLDALDALFDAGGHMLLLMPASDAPLRYKYLERALEEFSVRMDYDCITDETDGRFSGQSTTVLMDKIGTPEGMYVDEALNAKPLFLSNARSFHFFYTDDYTNIRQDAMLETGAGAVGTPCGGTEEDPETFTGEQLMTMLWSRNNSRGNASIVAVGSNSFLMDGSFDHTEPSVAWLLASVSWQIWNNNR